MIKVSVTNTIQVLRHLQKEKDALMTRIADDVKQEAIKNTPIDKGRARKGWRQHIGTNPTASSVIERNIRIFNNTPYINALERGRSKQSPKGITQPTLSAIQKRRYR